MTTIGIRREDKHAWEARAPLTPDAVARLVGAGLQVLVQPSSIRVYPDERYRQAGAVIDEDLSRADVVFAIKEIPAAVLREGAKYVFFSHTIKGQPHNMAMLERLMDLDCTLIDYERIVDDTGRRLVFFGRHAGLAGMIDTLAVLGKRLAALGIESVFSRVGMARDYADLEAARVAIRDVGRGLHVPEGLAPFVVGFAGYGNVSGGAQEILDLLPVETIAPDEVATLVARTNPPRDRIFKVVYHEQHLVEPRDGAFALEDYYQHPERYRSLFEEQAQRLSVLINAIFWTEKYPRLLTRATLRRWAEAGTPPRLVVIGDISCDLEGAVECTLKATTPADPAYVYEPIAGTMLDGVAGPGIAMMTTDSLPCELPVESSESFTAALMPFVADIARADTGAAFADAALPGPIRRAVILWRGELTPDYGYMADFVAR